MIKWKLLRAFSAFPSDETKKILEEYLVKSRAPALRWEAARSLAQTGTQHCLTILEKARNEEKNSLVKRMIDLSMAKLKKQNKEFRSTPGTKVHETCSLLGISSLDRKAPSEVGQ